MNMEKNKKIASFVLHAIIWIGVLALYVAVIMWLWNWLVPGITGWKFINFWQALGLFALAHLLGGTLVHGNYYKGHYHGGYKGWHHHHKMSKERRKEVLQHLFSRVGNDLFSIEVESELLDKKQNETMTDKKKRTRRRSSYRKT